MSDSLSERVAAAIAAPVPELGPWKRLWWIGTGPFHDAAELGTFPFAGSGRSAAAVAGEGHARLGELLGPQDVCVLVGGDPELQSFARRVATGTGATVVDLDVRVDRADDPTTGFAVAGARVLALCRAVGAPGVTASDLDRLPAAVASARSTSSAVLRGTLGEQVIVMGSGPAAVTARHIAVALRAAHPAMKVEGLDAQDVPGAASDHLGAGTTVIALDTARDDESPVARLVRMATVEGATVIQAPSDHAVGAVPAQLPLAVELVGPLHR